MGPDLSTLRQLPGINHYLSRLCQELGRGCSVLSIIPQNHYVESIWQMCIESLWHANFDVEEIEIIEPLNGLSPIKLLSRSYLSQDTQNDDLQVLMSCQLPQIIALRGLENVDPSTRATWLTLWRDWAINTQRNTSITGYKPTSLWGIYSFNDSNEQLPTEDTWLQLCPWWSVISILDVRTMCRLSEGVGQSVLTPYISWRESIMAFLAGNDLDIVKQLWNIMDSPKQQIYDVLLKLAQERDWTVEKLKKWGVRDYLRNWQRISRRYLQTPTRQERTLWLRGILYQTPEYGVQVSTVALAVLKEWEMLDHLLWRGQATFLLPVIDEYRLSICQELTNRYSPDWAWQWSEPISSEVRRQLIDNPMAAEWGQLENSIRKCPYPNEKKAAWFDYIVSPHSESVGTL